jgi:hypothetical protein
VDKIQSQRQIVSESVSYLSVLLKGIGADMADRETDGVVATRFRYWIEGHSGIAAKTHGNRALPASEHGKVATRKNETVEADEENAVANPRVVAMQQWICFLLGLICISCGIVGIWIKRDEALGSADIAWLGSAYWPTLRLTAVICVALGVALVRRGWAPH